MLRYERALLGERRKVEEVYRQTRAIDDARHTPRDPRVLTLFLPAGSVEQSLGLDAIERGHRKTAGVGPGDLARDRRRGHLALAEEDLAQECGAIERQRDRPTHAEVLEDRSVEVDAHGHEEARAARAV